MPTPLDPKLIHDITPRNFLSFGPENPGLELRALNLLIGPNGSGKSNLIEAISFMRSAPKELRDVTRRGGGVAEWIWKGQPKDPASVEWIISPNRGLVPYRHLIAFRAVAQAFSLDDERVENTEKAQPEQDDVFFYYRYQHGQPTVSTLDKRKRSLSRETIEPDRSILAQRRDPEAYPELAWLAQNY